jgi:hypothetical protein
MNNELEKIWKDVAMAQFKVLTQYLLWGNEENCETSQLEYLVSVMRFKPETIKCKV